ncbi:MAG: PaaI family thioesterase [Nitriliruptorales bacterium]|nr:PaaI family thioesterase [Nitriliruptorales bacterium]
MDEVLKGWHERTAIPPVGELLGAHLVDYGDGRATMTMEASAAHHNAMGTLHGGLLGALADMAIGGAIATTLEDGESFTTLTLNANYLGAVVQGSVTASAEVVRRGRRTAFVRCRIDHGDRHVAEFDSICMILAG